MSLTMPAKRPTSRSAADRKASAAWRPEHVAEAMAWLDAQGGGGIERTVMLHEGATVWEGVQADVPVPSVFGLTKCVFAGLVGSLVDDGRIGLDTPLATIEPLLRKRYPAATLRHFLTMTSGYAASGINRWREPSADWSVTPFKVAAPLFAPGERFCYWDVALIMLGRAITRVAGRRLDAELHERLFGPLGIRRETWAWWTEDAVRGHPICMAGSGLSLSARGMARYAQLWLDEGRAGNCQLLSRAWIRQAGSVQVPPALPVAETDRSDLRGPGIYGFLWWLGGIRPPQPCEQALVHAPAGTLVGWGGRHHAMLVVPAWRMVFVRLGGVGSARPGYGSIYDEFLRRLGPPATVR